MRVAASLVFVVLSLSLPAQDSRPDSASQPSLHDTPFSATLTARIPWRCVGPANMGGRITDVEVPELAPRTIYAATGGGHLWKSVNNGTTWETLFTDQPTNSIGDVATAPTNPQVVWVGTGEENARNSVSWGDGVYKSTDGGKTWKHMGLQETFQIGHIAIHPKDPEIVYVAALGRLWGPNDQRGLFRTKDGGKTWKKVLFVDDKTGCIDVRIDPERPDTVYAATYERKRDIYDSNDPIQRHGKGSAIWRSDDGGERFQKLTKGLPTCTLGRVGITLWRKQPTTVFAIVETEKSGWATGTQPTGRRREQAYLGVQSEDATGGALLTTVTEGSPAWAAGLRTGDLVTQIDTTKIGGSEELTSRLIRARPEQKAKFEVQRGGEAVVVDVTYGTRPGGQGGGQGGGRRGGGSQPTSNPAVNTRGIYGDGLLGGQAENVQDEQGELGFETGGVFRSDDRGDTWRRLNSLDQRPFYYSIIQVDPQDDKQIMCVGTSLWRSSDGGETFASCQGNTIHVDFHALWIDPNDGAHIIAGCDGGLNVSWDRTKTWEMLRGISAGQFYHVATNNSQPYLIAGGMQDNNSWVAPSRTRFSEGIGWEDCWSIGSGDGFGACFDPDDDDFVYITSQNGGIGGINLKTGARRQVQKPQGVQRYCWDTPFFVSPHNAKVLYFAGNRAVRSWNRGQSCEIISESLTRTEQGGASSFAESPVQVGLLYLGTDDGNLWRTQDGGKEWTRLHLPMIGPRHVSSIHPSKFHRNRVYVTCDGHRSDDDYPYVFVSDNAGDTWTYLGSDLPMTPVHVCREDPTREDLLFLGTEFGCFVSLDRGLRWLQAGRGLPTVAVRDVAFQNRDQDLVAATHGRGAWILDIAPLRQLTAQVARKNAHLFVPETVVLWRTRGRDQLGHKELFMQNPPAGVRIYLSCTTKPAQAPRFVITDIEGKELGEVTGQAVSGLQTVTFMPERGGRRGGPGGGPPGGQGGAPPPQFKPGSYAVRCEVDGVKLAQAFRVEADPQPDDTKTASSGEGR